MKIAFVTEKYTPDIGGLAISSERLTHLLASAGHEIRVFAPTSNLPPSEKRILPSGLVSVTRFGAHKRLDDTLVDWFESILTEHKREPFNLIHAYFLTQAGFVATYAGKYLNIPSVVSIRGNDIERAAFDPGKFSHLMYALQNAGAVTTNAIELARKAKAFIDREVFLIPNGIDTDVFKPVEKNLALAEALGLNNHVTLPAQVPQAHVSKAKGLKNDKQDSSVASLPQSDTRRVIGFAGELREKKGLQIILAGYTQINIKHPSTLLIVGEIRQGDDQRAFDEFKLANPNANVIITGQVAHKDLPAYYSLMDVFVHPSLRDGMPNALLEAMACQLPVVATPVGGVLDVLEDRVNGRIISVNDANALAETLQELLDNSGLREKLGKEAREKVIQNHNPHMELESNLRLYRKLTSK